jgi:2-phosphoglycerate kinase
MVQDTGEALTYVFWIGGAPDAGKTSVARALSDKFGLSVYHYDQADLRHHERLATLSTEYSAFLASGMDERWVAPTPEELAKRAWRAFEDRFPFVMEELRARAPSPGAGILAEGFGLTPGLVAPQLSEPSHAVWLLPTEGFKQASMRRRGKGAFEGAVSDPERAARNLFERDQILAERIRREAGALGLTIIDVDGSRSIDSLAAHLTVRFHLNAA